MRKHVLTTPSDTAAPSRGKKNKHCAETLHSQLSKHLLNTKESSFDLLDWWWTNRRLAGFYHPAASIVDLLNTADQRILALDGPTNGEIAWNHLTLAERKKFVRALDQLKKALT